MEFRIRGPFKNTIYNLMRYIGYHFVGKSGRELNFVRSVAGNAFPRFDVYLTVEGEEILFDLHIDQKRPIYSGTVAHAGEYQGAVVEKEASRIKENLNR